MALPVDASGVTVTNTYVDGFGTALTGTVTFTPSTRVFVAGSTISVDPVVARVVAGALLAPDGVAPLVLAATDDPDLLPVGWTWRVEERVGAKVTPARYVQLPADPATRVLWTLSSVEPAEPGFVRVLSVNGEFPDAAGDVTVAGGGGGGGDVPSTRLVSTSGGIVGGGDLSANRTHSLTYGTAVNTVCQGNDGRLSDDRTPLAHAHVIGGVTGLQAALDLKATKPKFTTSTTTSGNIQLSTGTNTWGLLTGSPTRVIAAAAGDLIELCVTALRQANANIFLDWCVIVSAAAVRYMGTLSSTPPGEGNPALYHTALPATGGTWKWIAEAGDISGGNVTVGMAIRNTSGASSLLLASTDNPLTLQLENSGPAN